MLKSTVNMNILSVKCPSNGSSVALSYSCADSCYTAGGVKNAKVKDRIKYE